MNINQHFGAHLCPSVSTQPNSGTRSRPWGHQHCNVSPYSYRATARHCSSSSSTMDSSSNGAGTKIAGSGAPFDSSDDDFDRANVDSSVISPVYAATPVYSNLSTVAVPETSQEKEHDVKRQRRWPQKSDLYLVRTDGMSCTREAVRANGCLQFSHPSTQQNLLVWKQKPQTVMVLKKLGKGLQQEFINVMHHLAVVEGMKVVTEPHEYESLKAQGEDIAHLDTWNEFEGERLHRYIDFVVCLGGDGVMLHASSLFKMAIPPIIAFNLGSLGFLTNHDFKNFREDLQGVLYGYEDLTQCAVDSSMRGVHVTLRMRLSCDVLRRGRVETSYEVMNEVVVDRGANPYLSNIECWEQGRLITKVQADGVMLATPTGSTAYSVAAGGSMVHPNVPAILFTPICPHSLSFRPVVLPDYADVELRIPDSARCAAWVCFDGKERQELSRGDSVRVRMSPNPVPTINRHDQTRDWFGSLERCFGWNDRLAQKPFFG